jgi:hypothetical protein
MSLTNQADPPPDKKSRLPTHLPLLLAIVILALAIGSVVGSA